MARQPRPRQKWRTREHVIADLSVNHVERHVLLCGYTVERITHDYGLDLFLFTYGDHGEVEAGHVLLQLKATDHLKISDSGQTIRYRLQRNDVLAWLKQVMPVILVVYDATAERAYWLYVQAYFEDFPKSRWRRGGETITIRIPRSNVLDQAAVRQFARFRDRIQAQAAGPIHHHE